MNMKENNAKNIGLNQIESKYDYELPNNGRVSWAKPRDWKRY